MGHKGLVKAGVAAGWTAAGAGAPWAPISLVIVVTGFMLAVSLSAALRAMDARVQAALIAAALATLPRAPGRLRVVGGRSGTRSPAAPLPGSDRPESAVPGGQ